MTRTFLSGILVRFEKLTAKTVFIYISDIFYLGPILGYFLGEIIFTVVLPISDSTRLQKNSNRFS